MNYKNFNIHFQHEVSTHTFNGIEYDVLKYLPIAEKFDLIMTAIQKSNIDGIYNPIRLNIFFKLNIVYLYTNILFDIEDRVDEAGLYDALLTSGLLDNIMSHIEDSEMMELTRLLDACVKEERAYRNTAASIISKLVDDLPKNAEAAKEVVENFDQDKYAEVLNFVKALK